MTPEELDALIARLRTVELDDHERGCQMRCCTCTCGFDDAAVLAAKEAAAALEALRDDLREARHERDGYHAERDLAREDVARLRKLGDGMAEALAGVMLSGNHLALLIGADHPSYSARPSDALEHYGAGDQYEIWCAWRAIMHARTALAAWNLEALR